MILVQEQYKGKVFLRSHESVLSTELYRGLQYKGKVV